MATRKKPPAPKPARKPARKPAPKPGPARASRKKPAAAGAPPDGDHVARVLGDLRGQLRVAADLYIARVDAQLVRALARIEAAKEPASRRLQQKLDKASRVKPAKGRLKDLARLEGLADKLEELVKKA